MKTTRYIATILLAAASVSCAQEVLPSTGETGRIVATALFEGQTKGAPLEAVPDTFRLYAAAYSGSTPGATNYIYNEKMVKSSGKWTSENTYGRIPSDRTVLYWAVSGSAGVTLPSASATGWPQIGYVSPATAAAQQDVILASSTCSGSAASLTLPFNHLLCAFEAKVSPTGAFEGTITSVALKNVYGSGTYTLGTGWGNVTDKTTLTSSLNLPLTESDGGKSILSGASTLLVLPQTLPSDAIIEVTATVGGESVTAEASLSEVSVTAGHKAVLSLNLSDLGRKALTVESITITDWVNVAREQTPTKKAEAVFTVDDKGTQVTFAPGNLYWDGSKFGFEAHDYDCPTSWSANHVGHFFWSKDAAAAIATSYANTNRDVTDSFFAANGGAIEGWSVLSEGEWNYLIEHALARNSSLQYTITIAGKACVVLKPDGFSGTVAKSYTADQWAAAKAQYGLVALPLAGRRYSSSISSSGTISTLWSTTTDSEENASCTKFNNTEAYTGNTSRGGGYSVRLVSYVGLSATYSVASRTEVTLPAATFAAGTVAVIDWGDGDAEVRARPSGGSVTLSHTYASAYTGKVKINVKEGCVDFGEIKQEYFDALTVYDSGKVKKELKQVFVFTVDASGKKVEFSPGNLWYDGSEFHFEAHQYDYPTSWSTSHVGHFLWSPLKNIAISMAVSVLSGHTTTNKFFAADGRAVEGWTVLSKDEWDYLFSHALAKNSSSTNTITIAGKKCIVLKPDGFSGTVADSYTAEQWATAEVSGLVALPFAGDRNGSSFYNGGSNGDYWSGTPDPGDASYAYRAYFNASNARCISSDRLIGYSVRLVSVQ